jgi:hypothetical protein
MATTLAKATTSFAHLVGLRAAPPPPAAAAKAEDDEDMKKDRYEEDDNGDDKGEAAEEKEVKGGKAKKGKKAKKDREEENEDDPDDDEDEEGDDDGDDEEMSANAEARAPRLRERARCAAIFADPAAAQNPALAAQLAFGTSLPRSQAIRVLRAGGVPAGKSGLAERMARAPTPPVGPNDPPTDRSSPKAIADGVIAAYEQARGLVRTK